MHSRWFVDLIKVFTMDLLGFLNIGCVAQYNYMQKFTFAMLLAPLILLGVAVTYHLRKGVDGIVNRCIKMVFLTLFLIYPFVSQTVFQGFSCRRLDEDEEWLEVDFQISCSSDAYTAFKVFGFFGVCFYPIGIPTITLLQLMRNSAGIKTHGPGRERYEFLVSDYKPEYLPQTTNREVPLLHFCICDPVAFPCVLSRYYYWDCLEMLRKAFLTGILIFYRKGSLFQLIVAMAFSLGFLCGVAVFQPYASRTANLFKVAAEAALMLTLILIALLKIDLSQEDVPGGEAFVGFLLLLSNTVVPGAGLALATLAYGLDLGSGHTAVEPTKQEKVDFTNPVTED